jgi:hypothetical protein
MLSINKGRLGVISVGQILAEENRIFRIRCLIVMFIIFCRK